MSKVSFIVDGKRIEAKEGELLLPVLNRNGISVPHFCYHEALGPDGNCRMCMVEIEGQKRPQIACDTPIKQGMVVNTKNESINQVKRSILELELLSHPVDCPICDQAGECKLQDYYMEFGLNSSRRSKEEKTLKSKHVNIGKNIVLDQERCVLCARCTRFTQEITQTNELSIIGRGNEARVHTIDGMKSDYSMNVVDLCPVGALTSKDFRFKQRVWFLESAKSICHGCAKGCNIYIDHNQLKYEQDTIYRFRPRVNTDVNGYFICDDGRLSYKDENINRLDHCYYEGDPIEINEAIQHLRFILASTKPLLILSPSMSLENMELIQDIAKKFSLEINAYSEGYHDESFGDDYLRSNDRSANLASVKQLGIDHSKEALLHSIENAETIINFNHKAFIDQDTSIKKLLFNKEQVHLSTHNNKTFRDYKLILSIASFSEESGTLVNEDGVVQHYDKAVKNDRMPLFNILSRICEEESTCTLS